MKKRKIHWLTLISFIILANLIGALGALWTSPNTEWYQTLAKPSFNPPNWIFGPVWTILFSLLGIAFYLVLNAPPSKDKKRGLIVWSIQYILNIFWSYLFFGSNNPFYALIDLVLLLSCIILTTLYFYRVQKYAGYLLIPYLMWVSFALLLNYAIWKLN